MRIVTFSTLYPNAMRPNHGVFVETRLRQVLGHGGIEARVVAPVPWFPFTHETFGEYAVHARAPREETRYGIEVLHPRYPVVPKVGMTVAPLLMARAVRPAMERLLARYPFDVIDAHYFYPDGVAAVMLGRYLDKPVVITGRGTDLNVIPQYRMARHMIRWAAMQAAGIVTVCRALKERLIELGVPADRVVVLRNGVNLEQFRPVDRSEVRARLGFSGRTLLSVGSLMPLKGHDIVIRALQLLPDCSLVIAGQGPEHMRLAELARTLEVAHRVTFAGVLSQEDLRQYYGAADVLVLASSREGWANVLLESLACGTPVIASNVGGTAEVITSSVAGLLIEQRTPEAVEQAVRRLFACYPERPLVRRYAEQFSWNATSEGQLDLFCSVMQQPRTRTRARVAVEA